MVLESALNGTFASAIPYFVTAIYTTHSFKGVKWHGKRFLMDSTMTF